MSRGAEGKRRLRRTRLALAAALASAGAYVALAYLLLPWAWTHHEHQPGLRDRPMTTRTAEGIAGDPINVGLVGSRADVLRAMQSAGWSPADPVTWRTSLEIVGSVVLDRPYRDAPVSPLYYDGRREDLAFEKPVGGSAERRHHVRFWEGLRSGTEGRPVWLGSATFDRSVGFSRYTGAVTHHVAPDIDDERDGLARDLAAAGAVDTTYTISGIGPTLLGRNGEGDRYVTDGEVLLSVLRPDGETRTAPPAERPAPALVGLKDRLFRTFLRPDRGAAGGDP